jgi:molybdopterin molybdotransferase
MPPPAPTLPGYDEALARVLRFVPALGVERVALRAALGRVLREDVKADRDQPPFDRAAMDGFAVRSGEVRGGVSYRVAGGVAAGELPPQRVEATDLIRIATGAPVPPPFDAVVPIEQAKVEKEGDGERVTFDITSVKPWQSVHRRAVDARQDDAVLRAGTMLHPQHIGVAAAVGAAQLTVARRPRITLLTTGDEIVPSETATASLQPQQVRNSNGPMLAAFFECLGVPLFEHLHVSDDAEETRAAAREALARSQLVVTNGGVSAGQRDWLPWAWEKLGLATVLRGVAIQPGKPVLVCSDAGTEVPGSEFVVPSLGERGSNPPPATRNPEPGTHSKLVLGLPGNPVSVLATAHLFAWPVLRMMLMNSPALAALPWRGVPLAQRATASARRQVFRAAKLNADGGAGILAWHGSGDLMHTAGADCLLRLPLTDDPIEPGTIVPCLEMVR